MRTALLRRIEATQARKANLRRSLRLEPLEPRMLLALSPPSADDRWLSGHGGACQCPVCTGIGLDEIPVVQAAGIASAATTPLSGLPQLSSNRAARAKLYLDFNGHVQASWGTFGHVTTPIFDQDGNPSSWSSGELATIREVWARVAEDYAPFDIDVTTIDPGILAAGLVARVVIGGHYSDWYESSAGGVAYVGGFSNPLPNVAYVFEEALGNGNPRYVAEAAAHEAGHLFGLSHQAVWNGGTLVDAYNSGSEDLAPIMGTAYYAACTTWHRGPSTAGPGAIQDDMAIIAGPANGFGWRPDDYGGTLSTAAALPTGTSVNLAGVIGGTSDVDLWSFTTLGGNVSFQLAGSQFGSNLDAVLELRDATGRTILSAAPSNSLGASLATTLGRGTYYLAARSQGRYGSVGQYTIRGTLPATAVASSPEISLRVQGAELSDAASVTFGTTTVGTPVTRTFTVTNSGSGTLSLSPLGSGSLPSGFTLASNLGRTSLAAGQSTTFSIRFDARTIGRFGGRISLRNSDANEAVFDIHLSASSTAAPPRAIQPPAADSTAGSLVKRILDNGASGFARSGPWSTTSGRGVAGDIYVAPSGGGTSSATWSFAGISNGQYQVYGSWTGGSGNATNAPLTLYNGSTPLTTVRMNQRVGSAGLSADGASWKYLGTVVITAGRLNVRLSNAADGFVVADAIRIVQTRSAAAAGIEANAITADLGLLAWLAARPDHSSGDETTPRERPASIEAAVARGIRTEVKLQKPAAEPPGATYLEECASHSLADELGTLDLGMFDNIAVQNDVSGPLVDDSLHPQPHGEG
jgi:hypothetical protein